MSQPYRFLDIPLIDSPDDDQHGWKYEAVHRLIAANRMNIRGNTDLAPSVQSLITDRASQLFFDNTWVLAVQGPDDAPEEVGWARVGLTLHEDLDKAHLAVCVHPLKRRQGIGSALLAWGEQLIADAGRTLIFGGAMYGPGEDHEPYLTTSEGSTVPTTASGVSFSMNRGYEVAQAQLQSVLAVPLRPSLASELMAQTLPHTTGYKLHTWYCEIPQEWKDSFANLKEAFSLDAPQGGLQFEQEHWDVDRVDQMVQEVLSQGDLFVMTAAEHIDTSEIVGFTELRWSAQPGEEAAEQWFTIVSSQHRGHRLGMWMKLVNLDAFMSRCPGVRRVYTDNAQENAHMLAINVAMGFQPGGGEALIVKNLS